MTQLLSELPVLAVDCQSTGASPKHGHLLELAWSRFCAADKGDPEVASYVLQLPDGEEAPRHIRRMTGIGDEELSAAQKPAWVWGKLCEAADLTERAVIHYATFERAFLAHTHEQCTPDEPFPLDIVCTHAIAQRLFADLPRRGIRALAGYLGHTLPEKKRAAHHVQATVVIWQETVRALRLQYGVETLDQLYQWLEHKEPTRRAGKGYAIERDARLSIPDRPGVYRMLGKNEDVLYVGKATSLNRRVNSYFRTRRGLSERKLELVTQVWDVDVEPVATPLEAALREADAIKEHDPPYNRALRMADRHLSFADRSWLDFANQPSPTHPVGPLRSTRSLRLAAVLHAPDAVREWLIEEGPEYVREAAEWLDEGIAEFRRRHGSSNIRRLAARLHHEAELAKQQADDIKQEEDDADEDAAADVVWTPELVADTLESALRRAHRQLRRSRWLCLLTDAKVAWRPAHAGCDGRWLVFQAGQVVDADSWNGQEFSAPPGAPRSFGERQACFDIATWDRLRVLTTELRRLVAKECEVEVHLGAHRMLGRRELTRLFRWI